MIAVAEKIRRYEFEIGYWWYEDELPDDMTDADYDAWFALSWVDGVRIGPRPIPNAETVAKP